MLKRLAITIAFLLAGTGTAHAATARVTLECDKYGCNDYVIYEAAEGERNVLSTEVVGTALIIRDSGARVIAGDNCVPTAGGVSCRQSMSYSEYPAHLRAFLGDDHDVATADGDIFGGRGNDRLTGKGSLSGGPGNDVLTGAGDFFDDDGAKPGHDVYRGSGNVSDRLSYSRRGVGVRVDLRAGRRSEDRISGIHSITGGRGDDVLIGDDSADLLDGAQGRDRLYGHGGDDTLYTGENTDGGVRGGPETVDAGYGNDEIEGADGPAQLRCGPGEDSVFAERGNVVERGCELVASAFWDKARLHATLSSVTSAFLSSIPFCEQCSLDRWRAKAHGRIVAGVSARRQPARLRLNLAGRRLLRRHRQLTLQIERHFVLLPRQRAVSGFTIRVRLP